MAERCNMCSADADGVYQKGHSGCRKLCIDCARNNGYEIYDFIDEKEDAINLFGILKGGRFPLIRFNPDSQQDMVNQANQARVDAIQNALDLFVRVIGEDEIKTVWGEKNDGP